MKQHIYIETTVWTDGSDANHIYIFADRPSGRTAKAVAYVPAGTDQVKRLRTPLTLDLKGRTFKELT
jgi:hypothetical protein